MIKTVGYSFLFAKRAKIRRVIKDANKTRKKMVLKTRENLLLELYLSEDATKALAIKKKNPSAKSSKNSSTNSSIMNSTVAFLLSFIKLIVHP